MAVILGEGTESNMLKIRKVIQQGSQISAITSFCTV